MSGPNQTRISSAELRASYVDFFVRREHLHVPSASLVPAEMATTLFTIAGMEPFVPIFLGESPAPARRAVSVQRCLRVAGAKSDIENVGRTGRHGTFLEMLGNFGFADYGKREAIAWAWEYLTGELKLDPQRLYITVHTGDDEAQAIWEKEIGVATERISRFDDDNFWTMGPTGPCGPSSEIFFDTGAEHADGPGDTGPNLGSRYVEIWNLVFQQFNREADGSLRSLPNLNIDTGAGLERVLAVVNGRWSMYETDLFTDLIEAQPSVGVTPLAPAEQLVRRRIIADHARAATALIADGIFPSNADRGYVLRFLIRRAIRNGRLLGYPAGFLTELVPAVATSLASGFPELPAARDRISGVLGREEAVFERTLERGEARLERYIDDMRSYGRELLAGTDAFALHDTFGFPLELTREILADAGLGVDIEGFTGEMEAQRTRARNDAVKKRAVVSAGETIKISRKSEFTGYEGLEAQGTILEILREDGTPVDEAIAGEKVRLILDRTSFYAERGGQIGDHGMILSRNDARFSVEDAQALGDAVVHLGSVVFGAFERGETVQTIVDEDWRREIRRHHTSAHLLQYALRKVLGPDVTQAGSWVGPERMRFDFRSPAGALTPEQKNTVVEIVNSIIRDDTDVVTEEMPATQARASGAISMAGELYGDTVRVLRAGPSLEFCGGTHAHRTGEIGFFVLLSESSIGSGIRRIEGLVSRAAERHIAKQLDLVSELAVLLTVRPEEIAQRVARLQNDVRERERELADTRARAALTHTAALWEGRQRFKGVDLCTAVLADIDAEGVKGLTTALRVKAQSAPVVIALIVTSGQKVALFVTADEKATAAGAHAGNILRAALGHLGGKGGGSAQTAQGGGTLPENAAQALAAIEAEVRKQLRAED